MRFKLRQILPLGLCVGFSLVIQTASASLPKSKRTQGPQCKRILPVPKGCGVRGDLKPGSQELLTFIQPLYASSVEECATMCSRREVNATLDQDNDYCNIGGVPVNCRYCRNFGYNMETGSCQLYGRPVMKYVKQNAAGSHIFSNRDGCYSCPPTGCEAPYHTDILDNGDFEATTLGPWYSIYGSVGPGHNSSMAWKCFPNPERYPPRCQLWQAANTCPGGLYLMHFDYKLPKIPDPLPEYTTGFEFYATRGFNSDGSDMESGATFTPKAGDDATPWKSMSAFARIPSGDKYSFASSAIEFDFADRLGYLIDNVKMIRVPTNPLPKAGAKNLLKNGGFESGRFKPWAVSSSNWTITTPGINSKYAATSSGEDDAIPSIVQTVSTEVGTSYLLNLTVSITPKNNPAFVILYYGVEDDEAYFIWDDPKGKGRELLIPCYARYNSTRLTIFAGTKAKLITVDNISFKEIAL